MPPAPGQEEAIRRMTKIVNSLLSKDDCAPFREPVDWRGLELFDYPKVIKKMMDLGTIKRRLERGQYATAAAVADDVRIVWGNCMSYNADGSDFWLLAKSFARRFEDRYRKVKQDFDVGEDWEEEEATFDSDDAPSRSKEASSSKSSSSKVAAESSGSHYSSSGHPSLDVKATFGANLFLLSGVELGYVMTTLEMECPHSFESWGDCKTEINVDAIPTNVFGRLSAFVNDKVGTKSHYGDDHSAPAIDDVSNKKRKRKS